MPNSTVPAAALGFPVYTPARTALANAIAAAIDLLDSLETDPISSAPGAPNGRFPGGGGGGPGHGPGWGGGGPGHGPGWGGSGGWGHHHRGYGWGGYGGYVGGCWRYDRWGRWRNFCLPPPYGYY
jgi:hypothetical protein